ncbi:protein SPMIP7 [Leptodactylus fuscus]|uniref:protein SPMIP7 n=1 Tax=Leptodactylus fuscus TaxID=238119 RepID=UPI003F4ED211
MHNNRHAEHRCRSQPPQANAMADTRRAASRGSIQSCVTSPAGTFVRFNPLSSSPDMPGYSLHPLRDDMTIVDPCSGFISPGAEAELRPVKAPSALVDLSNLKPQQVGSWKQSTNSYLRCKTAPPVGRVNSHTILRSSPLNALAHEESPESELIHKAGTRWNSVSRSDVALRATLGGWTSKVKAIPQLTHGPGTSLTQTFTLQQKCDASCSRDNMVRKFMYTSSTQRAYEDIPWDNKLPAKVQPPETTIEKMPDPISQCFTLKRYELHPEIWQITSGMWDRFQTRLLHERERPLSFGFSGSANSEDIYNPYVKVIPFTKTQTEKPQYTNTAHCIAAQHSVSRVQQLTKHC